MTADVRFTLVPEEAAGCVASYRDYHAIVHHADAFEVLHEAVVAVGFLCFEIAVGIFCDDFGGHVAFNLCAAVSTRDDSDGYIKDIAQRQSEVPCHCGEFSGSLGRRHHPAGIDVVERFVADGLGNGDEAHALSELARKGYLLAAALDGLIPEAAQRHFHVALS